MKREERQTIDALFKAIGNNIRKEKAASSVVRITAHASASLSGNAPQPDADLAPFFPESLDAGRLLEQTISNHVDFKVVNYLLRYLCNGSALNIAADQKIPHAGFTLTLELI